MTRTKESLPINWITACLSNYLLLVSSTAATKEGSRLPQGSSLKSLVAFHSRNSPWSTVTTAGAPATPQGLTSATCAPLAQRSPIYVSRAQDTPCIRLQISYLSHKQLKLNSRFFYQNHSLLPQPSISGQQKASPPNNHSCLHVSHTFPSHCRAPSCLSAPLPPHCPPSTLPHLTLLLSLTGTTEAAS